MLERMWAGWRNNYVRSIDTGPDEHSGLDGDGGPVEPTGATPDGMTLFEGILATAGKDAELGIVHRGALVSALLNIYPYGSGHLLVVPNRGVARLSDLTAAESRELWDTVDHAVAVCEAEYECPGINVGLNQGKAAGAGVPEHLHVHVVPRWAGDTSFTTSIAETRVLSETLEVSGQRLRSRWPLVPHRS